MDMQKFGAELIETSAEIGLVIVGQFVFLMRPNLVEHASEIDQATDFADGLRMPSWFIAYLIKDSPGHLQVAIALETRCQLGRRDRRGA